MTTRERPKPTPIPKSKAGLSLGYRFFWRLHYTLLAWGGPAQRPLEWDPRERMRRDRVALVAQAEAAGASPAAATAVPSAR